MEEEHGDNSNGRAQQWWEEHDGGGRSTTAAVGGARQRWTDVPSRIQRRVRGERPTVAGFFFGFLFSRVDNISTRA